MLFLTFRMTLSSSDPAFPGVPEVIRALGPEDRETTERLRRRLAFGSLRDGATCLLALTVRPPDEIPTVHDLAKALRARRGETVEFLGFVAAGSVFEALQAMPAQAGESGSDVRVQWPTENEPDVDERLKAWLNLREWRRESDAAGRVVNEGRMTVRWG